MTKEKFMPELSRMERIRAMEDNAQKYEDTKMYVPLSQEELDVRRERLTQNLIDLDIAVEAFEIVKEEHKGKINPIKAENVQLLATIRSGQELREGRFYHIPDYVNSVMRTYDEDGECINERRLQPNERQGGIFQKRTGTEG